MNNFALNLTAGILTLAHSNTHCIKLSPLSSMDQALSAVTIISIFYQSILRPGCRRHVLQPKSPVTRWGGRGRWYWPTQEKENQHRHFHTGRPGEKFPGEPKADIRRHHSHSRLSKYGEGGMAEQAPLRQTCKHTVFVLNSFKKTCKESQFIVIRLGKKKSLSWNLSCAVLFTAHHKLRFEKLEKYYVSRRDSGFFKHC